MGLTQQEKSLKKPDNNGIPAEKCGNIEYDFRYEIRFNERKVKYDNSHRTHRQCNVSKDGTGEVIEKK